VGRSGDSRNVGSEIRVPGTALNDRLYSSMGCTCKDRKRHVLTCVARCENSYKRL
jgi:hypothetical protein